MKPEHLFTEFRRLSEAPDGINRLRRFILDLAVRGKLLDQHSADVPTSKLLAAASVPALPGGRSGRLGTGFPREEDVPFSLPSTWLWCRLDQVGMVVGGGTPTSSDSDNFTPGGTGIPWLTPADMGLHSGAYIAHGARDLTPRGLAGSSATLMPKCTILFTSRAPIGYVAIASQDVTTNQGFKSLVPSSAVVPGYVALYFRAFKQRFETDAPGTTFKEVSGKLVAAFPFPLPPLEEQQRIVAKVDELMVLCDGLAAAQAERERRRDRLSTAVLQHLNSGFDLPGSIEPRENASFFLEHLPQLSVRQNQIPLIRTAILALAVRGRLVQQDASEVPATVTLGEAAEKKKFAGRNRTGRDWNKGNTPSEDYALQNGWAWTRIGDAVERVTVGFVGSMTAHYTDDGVPFLRSQNVRAGSYRSEGLIYITRSFHQKILKSALEPGDVVIVRSGNVGTACVVPLTVPEANCSDLVIVKRPLALLPEFLCYYLNSVASERVVAGTVGMALSHFNTNSVATMPIPVPPLAEQGRIVSKVESLLGVCDELEQMLGEIHTAQVKLLEAVLADALAANSSGPNGN